MIRTIPLNKLVPPRAMCGGATDEQADLELKADIEARGLLQNLVVTAAGKPRGSFAVEAGGRRLRALQSLADEGKLAKDHRGLLPRARRRLRPAAEASLAENFQRLAMNPADECLAFQQLIEQGADVEGDRPALRPDRPLRRRAAAARRPGAGGVRRAWRRRDQPRRCQGLCGDAGPRAPGLGVRADRAQLGAALIPTASGG